jgi:caa(3)-type oxidase subunit IV
MDDEKRVPGEGEISDEEIEEIAHSVPAADEYPEGQAEELAERLEEQDEVTGLEEAVVGVLEATEEAAEGPVAETWDATITGIQEGIESIGPNRGLLSELAHQAAHAHHEDTTVIFGREFPVPVYTAVFAVLGILTLFEVMIAELISHDIKIPFLLGIAVAKALLVVIFYMHLKTDDRIFAYTLGIPVGVTLLSLLYLMAVPPT